MTRLIKGLALLFCGLFVCVVILAVLLVDTTPRVTASSDQQVDNADSMNLLLRQLRNVNRRRFSIQSIQISEAQMNSLVGLVQRALPDFSGVATASADAVSVQMTYRLPVRWVDWYLNFESQLVAGPGLNIDQVKVGGLSISGESALDILVWLANWRTDSDIGSQAVSQIANVKLFEQIAVVTLYPINDFLLSLNDIKNGLSGDQNEDLRVRTSYYLSQLKTLDIPQYPKLSLTEYIRPIFKLVESRSTAETAVLENHAAILALAIYTGHHRVANFVGDVQPVAGEVALPKFRPVLAKRTDLTQHFIISAAIKILSQQGISTAIGEFKELMDRAEGGSGFSFADLAADLAGVRLALHLSDQETALRGQKFLAQVQQESELFPAIADLPEGLSKDAFSQQYGMVDSPEYKELLAEINLRIDLLPIYQ